MEKNVFGRVIMMAAVASAFAWMHLADAANSSIDRVTTEASASVYADTNEPAIVWLKRSPPNAA